jgi:hypothetical protein
VVIDVVPGTEVTFNISQWLPKMNPDAEYHCTIRFGLLKNELWAPNGFEIASNQLMLQKANQKLTTHTAYPSYHTKKKNNGYTFSGKEFKITIDKTNGACLLIYGMVKNRFLLHCCLISNVPLRTMIAWLETQ